jgi:large subunit ribosomal protein L4
VVKHIEISDHVFAIPLNQAVVHQALVRQRANARQGTADTKTRGEVSGSSGKLFRQKHTGLARAGSRRSPLRRGGGIIFGPHPRSYEQAIPKKMRRLALRCVLSAKANEGELKVIERLELEAPKTKEMSRILAALGVDTSALITTSEPEENVIKSARNLPGIKTIPANILNVVDILSYKMLLMTEAAVRKAEQLWDERLTQGGNHAPV